MRTIMLLRGLPASGKSTFIKENNLEPFTVSTDKLRVLCGAYTLDLNGDFTISQDANSKVWSMVYDILEYRFKLGAFTILDATNIKTEDMRKTLKLAKNYRYRVYCVDFTDVSMEDCIVRDSNRESSERTGEAVIRRMGADLEKYNVPNGITVVKPNKWKETVEYYDTDLSRYNRVHHIGDIHGCNSCLQEYLKDGLKDDEFYIFLGDYIDRGIENVECMKFLDSIVDNENVVLLEGNHERWLGCYIDEIPSKSTEFEEVTRVQFNKAGSGDMQKICSHVFRRLRQCFAYNYRGKRVICTHGGISTPNINLLYINESNLIKGIGRYQNMKDTNDSFDRNSFGDEYQVHGHRNVEHVSMRYNNSCFNLCSQIEYGGNLRCLQLDSGGFTCIETPNRVFKKEYVGNTTTVKDLKSALTDNTNIKRVKQGNSSICSYNFTRKAFQEGIWDDITTRARGLFIDSETNEIVARGYNKFFNMGERKETNLDVLPNTCSYPVKAYLKENGFLGLLGYDKKEDKLLFCTKSEIEGQYAQYFKKILLSVIDEKTLLDYMRPHNVTLVFEVIDIENDPHIIKYYKNQVILLDIIENSVMFKRQNYKTLKQTANILGFKCKTLAATLKTKEEFEAFLVEIRKDEYKFKKKFIEGFVFEDNKDFMFKYKTEYYKFWKFMRSQVDNVGADRATKVNNDFLDWLRNHKEYCSNDIITLRELFTAEMRCVD